MIINPEFEITEVSGEYMVIPLGALAQNFNGIVAINDASAFLLKQMETQKSELDLVNILCDKYNVDEDVALHDVRVFVDKLLSIGVILES